MPVSWPQARRCAFEVAKPLAHVERALSEALGGTLAQPLCSTVPQPNGDVSAMDGFAIAGTGPWKLLGAVLAGGTAGVALAPGQAIRTATGAPLPSGTSAVLPVEHATVAGESVSGALPSKRHIRRRGEDFAAGAELLPAGTVLTSAALGLAAGTGHDMLTVHRRPLVRLLVTGDEVVRRGVPAAGQVRDAIGPMMPGLIRSSGGDIHTIEQVRDRQGALLDTLRRADGDVVLVAGGTSVGAADHLRGVLRALHAEVVVDGVMCRPGHPQLLARLPDGRFVVGLPGNPYAALAAVLTLVEPLLCALSGRSERAVTTAELLEAPTAHPHDTRLLGARGCGSAVVPLGSHRSGNLAGAAAADVLAVQPPQWDGSAVEVLPLP